MVKKKSIKRGFVILNRTFRAMHALEVYYLNQAGRGFTAQGDRSRLFRSALPSARTRDRQFFRQPLPLGPPIPVEQGQSSGLRVVATRDDECPGDIVSKHLTESTQNLIRKLKGRGRNHAHGEVVGGKEKTNNGRKPKKINCAAKKI